MPVTDLPVFDVVAAAAFVALVVRMTKFLLKRRWGGDPDYPWFVRLYVHLVAAICCLAWAWGHGKLVSWGAGEDWVVTSVGVALSAIAGYHLLTDQLGDAPSVAANRLRRAAPAEPPPARARRDSGVVSRREPAPSSPAGAHRVPPGRTTAWPPDRDVALRPTAAASEHETAPDPPVHWRADERVSALRDTP